MDISLKELSDKYCLYVREQLLDHKGWVVPLNEYIHSFGILCEEYKKIQEDYNIAKDWLDG